jgi:hypothetical protein
MKHKTVDERCVDPLVKVGATVQCTFKTVLSIRTACKIDNHHFYFCDKGQPTMAIFADPAQFKDDLLVMNPHSLASESLKAISLL